MDFARVPTGTYRLQLRREFGFGDAAAVVPYLASLGVSHVYCSPVLQAVPGSAHGYDVVDHRRLNDELGGADGWRALVAACRDHGLGIVADIVPNHMALPAPERLNAAFYDVLEHGQESPYADWFDVDWSRHDGRILLPVLGSADDDVVVDVAKGEVRYYEHAFPLAPGTSTLGEQHYLLADWRRGNSELNYRRFFDVTTLAGLRVEVPDVFTATHELLGELLHAGDIQGLRVDHPDGLADPRGYLESLEKLSGGVWTVVEKILEDDERLPRAWACDGTTGYDAAAAVTQLLVDPAGEAPMTSIYADFTSATDSYDDVLAASKRQVIGELFGAEIDRVCRELDGASREAVVEMLVRFPVYRTYDGEYVDDAAAAAKQTRPDLGTEIDEVTHALKSGGAFATRFAQTSGPVTAKGVEDTTFYRYNRLLALNEVGANPGRFGSSVSDFHEFCARLARDWPATMTTLSTHDTKRSEDVRARLAVLAEIPAEWDAAVHDWSSRAASYGTPDSETEYVFWQTLAGALPIGADRLVGYLRKAAREAKRHTSWLDPDEAYEERLSAYTRAVLADEALMTSVRDWVEKNLAEPGRSNSLSQKLIQLTMPGVPDVYQGQELPDFSLVDPDNRRPVDYDARRAALESFDTADPKLRLTATALRLRRDRPRTFAGPYEPLTADGPAANHVVAFSRGSDVVTVATRLPAGLRRDGGWRDARLALPDGEWRDLLTGRAAGGNLADLLASLPVALLIRDAA